MSVDPADAAALQVGLDAGGDGHTTADAATSHKKKGLGIGAWLAIAWLVIITLAAVLSPVLPLKDPNAQVAEKRFAPFQSGGPILGADANGRDMLSRTINGGRISLTIAVCAVLVGLLIGGFLGLISGYYRTWVGRALTSLFDILLAIPQLVLALALVSVLKGDPNQPAGFHIPIVIVLIMALGLVSIPILARITRASTLTWSQRDFVTAARAQGAGNGRILFREVLPNVAPAMFSIALLGMAIAIVAEGGLAILGVSVEPPQATWGTMVSDGKSEMIHAGFILWIPLIAIFLSAVSLNYLGDVIRERFDVRESAL
jgi:peptide/nickel transport system permease protein